MNPVISDWSLPRRIGFRFALAYWAIYSFPFPAGAVPGTEWFSEKVDAAWRAVVPWFASHVLALEHEITIFPAGSGDTTFNYVQLVCQLILAVFVTAIWSLIDRRRASFASLHDWLRVYLRFVLATAMWGYGMNKVIQLQFPVPSPNRLMSTYGDSSPMGLLWTFMGASSAYTAFAGATEVLGGALLFFRRTTTLGALVVIGVMTNVVMLNFCYDVPVKLYSSHLLMMAVFLVLPEAGRLFDVLILHRATNAGDFSPPPGPRWLGFVRKCAWCGFVGWVVFSNISGSLEARSTYGALAPKPPIYGVFEVEEFSRNGSVEAPLLTNASQWRRLAFSSRGLAIRRLDDSVEQFGIQNDEAKQELSVIRRTDKVETFTMHWSRPDAEHLLLAGKFGADDLTAKLRVAPVQTFFLLERGFHWINEFPLNR